MIITKNAASVKSFPPSHIHQNQDSPARSIAVIHIEPGDRPGVLAIVSVRVGGIAINGIVVVDRGRGLFINYPSRKIGARWIDIVAIVSPALRAAVDDVILAAVRNMEGAL